MYDALANSVASDLSALFGSTASYTQAGAGTFDVPLVVRLDVETIDADDQVTGRMNTVRIAHDDISVVPKREDTFVYGSVTYKVGRLVADDGYSYTHEITS